MQFCQLHVACVDMLHASRVAHISCVADLTKRQKLHAVFVSCVLRVLLHASRVPHISCVADLTTRQKLHAVLSVACCVC